MSQILIQAIGFAGVIFFIFSYQIKSNRALFLMQLLGTGMFTIQFILLGAYTGAINLMIIILRNALLLKVRDWKWVKSKHTMFALIALSIIGASFSWSGLISLLPLTATAGTMVAYWTDNAQKIRLGNLVCGSPCWLTYDILIGSLGGILNESITLISVLISIKRFGWDAMNSDDSGF